MGQLVESIIHRRSTILHGDAELTALRNNLLVLVDSINDCLSKRRLLPGLCLLYSGIDVVSDLEREPGEGRAAFLRWVDRYLLKARALPCSALELYAARCGIVHSFSAESDLSRQQSVRKVIYAWGTAKAENVMRAAEILHRPNYVAIHVSDLSEGFYLGLANYLDEVALDPGREARINAIAGVWLTNIDKGPIDSLLRFHDAFTSSKT